MRTLSCQLPQYLKNAAKKGEFAPIEQYILSIESIEQLNALKENKILCHYYCNAGGMDDIAKLYLEQVKKIPGTNYNQEYNYIQFIDICIPFIEALRRCAQEILKKYETCSFYDFLCQSISQLLKPYFDIKSKIHLSRKDLVETHNLIGSDVDFSRSISRLMSIASYTIRGNRYCQIPESVIVQLFNICSKMDALNIILDAVCYGEFKVTKYDTKKKSIVLDIAEKDWKQVRYQNLRRFIDQTTSAMIIRDGKFQSYWVDKAFSLAEIYCNYHQEKYRIKLDINDIKMTILRQLVVFGFDDEILIEVAEQNDDRILDYYYAGIAVLVYLTVLRQVDNLTSRTIYQIPLSLFNVSLRSGVNLIERIIDLFVADLPLENYTFFEKPFIRFGLDNIYCISPFRLPGMVAKLIRDRLITGGGSIGKRYGSKWEHLVAQVLTKFGWNVIEIGFKVVNPEKKNELLTDIDIIVQKNGIVLLIQVKGISEPDRPYDNWKANNIVYKGVIQAQLAKKHYKNQHNYVIQPLVIVPSQVLSGWVMEGIPVLGFQCFYNLLNIIQHEHLSANRIQHLLLHPNAWIKSYPLKKAYTKLQVADIEIKIPHYN